MPDSDFNALAQMGPAGGGDGGYDPRYGQELQQALGGMREFQAKLAVQNKQNEQMLPPGSMAVKTAKGTMDIKDLPIQTYEAMMRDREELNQIRGAFAQEAERLQQRETQVREQPWAQLATALSANLAQAKDMPGWVQAAGRTAGQLNPTADQLRTQRLAVLGEQAQMAEKAGTLDIANLRTLEASADRQAAVQARLEADRTQVEKDASLAARTVGEFDPESYVKEIVAKGGNPAQATAAAQRLDSVAKAKRINLEKAEAERQKIEADKEARFLTSLSAAAERTDKMIAAADRRAAEAAARGEAGRTAAAAKAKEPGPVLKKQLGDLNAADTALDEIEKIVTSPDNQGLFGPMGPTMGRIRSAGAAVGIDPGGKIAGIKQRLMLQTAQAIKATGAGARGFGPQERPYFEQLSEGIKRTPAQNLKIIEGWRAFLDQERRGIQISNPDVDFTGKYAPALGKRLGAPQESTEDTVKKLLETVKPR